MKVEQQKVGSVDVYTPVGPLVDDEGARFTKTLVDRLRSGNPRVAVNLQDVPYLDSQSLEGLLDAADELQDRALSLKLAGVSPTVREIFELTGLNDRFSFFKDVQDAVRSFL